MPEYLIRNPEGFGWGYTPVTRIGERVADTGINFGILRLRAGEAFESSEVLERVYLLLAGEVAFGFAGIEITATRGSLFDEDPLAAHLPSATHLRIAALRDSELAVFGVENEASFQAMLFDARAMAEVEHRGRGILEDTAYRIVRTIFDMRNRPQSRLALGEVVNFPGRWSSYPPHHHPQPEIYHYRFSLPQGYGHGEMGDDVLKVRQFDTVKILDGKDHSQVAAPGYAMFYVWAIRHLPGNPYTVPEFTDEHRWILEPAK